MTEVFFRDYLKLSKKRVPFATAVVVKHDIPISGKSGDKAIILNDGSLLGWIGGGCTNPIVIEEGLSALNSGKSKLIVIDPENKSDNGPGEKHFQMTCHSGGSLSVYVEPVFPRPLIVVMGNSPVAISLLKMSSELGYETLWTVNPEKENETLEVDRIQKTFDLKNINLSSPCFIIVCTQGENDWEALESAMKTSVSYVAFVGSRRKTETLKKELSENGVSPDRLGKMVNPAGLDLKARTPSEIALSILAEIVQLLRDDNTLDNQVVSESEEKAIDPVCGMKVDTELTKNTFQFKNQDYHFCCNGCKTKFKNNPELFLIAS